MTERLPCESCAQRPRIPGERFCRPCRSDLLRKLSREGFLEPRIKTEWNKPQPGGHKVPAYYDHGGDEECDK